MMKLRFSNGMIMVTVLMLLPICVMLAAIMFSNVLSEKRFLRFERDRGQSFYLAETGINSAYYAFSESTFTGFTHIKSNTETNPDEPGVALTPPACLELSSVIVAKVPFQRISSGQWEGWYEYKWDNTSSHASLTGTGEREAVRFRVSRTYDGTLPGSARSTAWEIVSVATLGATTKTHRLSGKLEGLTDHALFDAGDLNEFLRGQDQQVRGKVHANGDIFLKPSGTTLSIITDTSQDGFTTAGNIWWGVDATGRKNMGTVRIGETGPLSASNKWPNNLDSRSANWIPQATALWGDMVKDKSLGATVKGVPPTKSFEPDGFYAQTAKAGGLNISTESGTVKVGNDTIGTGPLSAAVKLKSFYNHAEKRTVECVQIDISKLSASDYANGLIYSDKPLILLNAQKLPHKSSIVSQSAVYTIGDFNKELATQKDYNIHFGLAGETKNVNHTTKVSASIMSKDRIWHLSKNFPFPANSGSGFKSAASDPEEYPNDNKHVNRDTANNTNNVIEVNGMLLDGAPLHDEVWNREVVGGQVVPKWGPTKADPNNQATSWDDYLEAHGASRVVKKRGSIVHLQNADMADASSFNNENLTVPAGETAWYRRVAYDAPFRDYGYDLLLKTDPPPFAPFVASRSMWKRY
jgi:Tfp pilus assembly protein PilX